MTCITKQQATLLHVHVTDLCTENHYCFSTYNVMPILICPLLALLCLHSSICLFGLPCMHALLALAMLALIALPGNALPALPALLVLPTLACLRQN